MYFNQGSVSEKIVCPTTQIVHEFLITDCILWFTRQLSKSLPRCNFRTISIGWCQWCAIHECGVTNIIRSISSHFQESCAPDIYMVWVCYLHIIKSLTTIGIPSYEALVSLRLLSSSVLNSSSYRACLFSKSSLARLQEFWNSSIRLYEIKRKNLFKSTCRNGSFTCPWPSGCGNRRALSYFTPHCDLTWVGGMNPLMPC